MNNKAALSSVPLALVRCPKSPSDLECVNGTCVKLVITDPPRPQPRTTIPPECKVYEECYDDHPCPTGDYKCVDNICYPGYCGGEGQACCDCVGDVSSQCTGDLKCIVGLCLAVPCGEYGQPCCDNGVTLCGEDMACLDGRCYDAPCKYPEGYEPYVPKPPASCPGTPDIPEVPLSPEPVSPDAAVTSIQ